MTVRVLSTMDFEPGWLARLAAVSPEVEIHQIPAAHADELPTEVLRDVEVLYTGSAFPLPEQAPRLRWVQLDTSGADHVRGTPLWHSDVAITSLGGVSPRPMAEYVAAMVLGFAHKLPRAARDREERRWPTPRERWQSYRPLHVPGSRMVIVGYGTIGCAIARTALTFGIEVVGVRRGGRSVAYADEPPGVVVVRVGQLREQLPDADWVVVVVPGTPETTGLIGPAEFAAMKPAAHLINVARGGVVDERAMLAALDSGRLAGAALDVFADEPLGVESVLWEHPLVVLTPHISGLASDYEQAVERLFQANLERYLQGRALQNLIDRRLGY